MEEGPFDGSGPGPHPLIGRQAALVRALWVAGIVAWVLAAAGVLLPGDAGEIAATALVALVIIAPVARVAWLGIRWIRRGDPRFAVLALALAAIVLSGAALAA